ncbi:hypothetical protein CLOP_g20111 [Closterium sp. NIES-67]|nr:hypothetical protein CLOP_g20111 [Closterium sp. NIES-67]
MDVVGPLKLGAAGAEYFLTIVDVYTRMTWVYVLPKKSDVAETGTTLRTLFVAAAIKGWVVQQMDIVTAFLNGVLEEETYMEQPEGYNDGSGREVMLKLQDKFKCKTLGDVNYYLGLHIERDVEKRWMRVHQKKYLETLAASFGKSEGHVATPLPSGFNPLEGWFRDSSWLGTLWWCTTNLDLGSGGM